MSVENPDQTEHAIATPNAANGHRRGFRALRKRASRMARVNGALVEGSTIVFCADYRRTESTIDDGIPNREGIRAAQM